MNLLYAGYVPGFAVTHAQDAKLNELNKNLTKVVEMLLEHKTR